MKQKMQRFLSIFLSFVMVLSVLASMPFTAYATETTETTETTGTAEILNTYDTVESTLAPGVTQTINQAYRDDGKYVKYYVAVADLNDPTVGIHATYRDAQCTEPGVSKMTEQVAAMTELHTNPEDVENYIENYAIVAGVNGDGYNVGTGVPSGAHVMNGVAGFGISKAGNSPWFAQFEDGTIACGRNNTDWDAAVSAHGAVQEAIGGFQLLMKDGVVYEPGTASTQGGSNYWKPGFDYPCSFLGVTYDNKLVLINCDGNNIGGSAGFDYDYTMEVAKELNLKDLLCLDGGGSATFLSRQPGDEIATVISNPSDGGERAVANGLVVYTTTPASDVFASAVLETEDTHYTPYSEISVTAQGISPAGTPADIPAEVEWGLSDTSFGTISDGLFVSNGKIGKVSVQMLLEGAVVGEQEIHIVNPTSVGFTHDTMVVPYGKTDTMKMEASYYDEELQASFPLKFKASDFEFVLSDAEAGTIKDFELTAPTDETKSTVTITATYKHAVFDSFSIVVTYGKASEIMWDFEDGDVSNWLGNEDMLKWIKDNGLEETSPATSLHGESIISSGTSLPLKNTWNTNTITPFLATAENGQVKNGEYALGVTVDATHYSSPGNWNYSMFFNVEGQVVLRDVANGKNATSVGMWVYLPEELIGIRYTGDQAGFAMQITLYAGDSKDNVSGIQMHLLLQDTGLNTYNTTDPLATEVGRWVYMSADISQYDYVSLQNPRNNIYKEPQFIRFYTKRLEPKKYTFYYDDFTLDYSSAVVDRDAPIISDPKYIVVDNATDFSTVCTQNKVLLTANIAEFEASNASGLNYDSAKIYVDGVALDKVNASGNTMISEEVTLTSGTHEIIYEISDNMGTITRNKEMLTISGDAPIWITGHNDSGALAEYDSVYYMDLTVADVADISKIVTEVSLNDANTWELPYLTVAEGFTIEYELCELTNSVKLTITKNTGCTLTGEQVLVSIPVRIWSWDETLYLPVFYNEEIDYITEEENWADFDQPIVPIDFEVEYGVVTYEDEKYNDYLGSFYSYYTTATMLQDDEYEWHFDHTATTLEDVDATCTKDGYTGRTYCNVCKSVVDWGTILPATGHTYAVTDGVLKCECGELYNGEYTDGKTYTDGIVNDGWVNDSYYEDGVAYTGVQLVDGYYYNFGEDGVCAGQTKITGLFYDPSVSAYRYAIAGELQSGWVNDNQYFDPTTKVAVTGEYYYEARGITYIFDETGKTEGTWQKTSAGIRYWYGKWYYTARNADQCKFVEIDGKTYNFNVDGFVTTGVQLLYADWAANMRDEMQVWSFDKETGALIEQITASGVVKGANGNLYLVEEDSLVHTRNAHVASFNDDVYFVHHSGKLQVNGEVTITEANGNGILTAGTYYFGEDGKLFSGMKKETDGELYYYDGGKLCSRVYNSELVKIDGDIYLVKWSGKVATNETRVINDANSNGLLAAGTYYFDAEGKAFTKTGVEQGADGVYYYYENGVVGSRIYNNKLVEIDDAIYMIHWSGKVAVNTTWSVTDYHSNGLVAPGSYYFGEDGKLLTGTSVVTGADGVLYYYENGQLGTRLYNSELVEVNGAIYLVKWSGKVASNETRTITTTNSNGLLVAGTYYFGEDGKLFTGVKADDGILYYYENGKVASRVYNNKLVEVNGDIYLVHWSGKVASNTTWTLTDYHCEGLVTPGTYTFDADGKLVK